MSVLRNIEARARDHCCRNIAISIEHSECALLSLAGLGLPYYFTLSYKLHDFRGKKVY